MCGSISNNHIIYTLSVVGQQIVRLPLFYLISLLLHIEYLQGSLELLKYYICYPELFPLTFLYKHVYMHIFAFEL